MTHRLRFAPAAALCFVTIVPSAAFAQQRVAPAAPRVAARRAPAAAAQGKPVAATPAAPALVRTKALAWAKERGLPVREIEVGPPERRVKRLFVPVTTANWASFVETFSSENSLMLKLKNNDNHLMAVVDGTYHLWARRNDYYNQGHEQGGGPVAPAVIVDLKPEESKHVREWLTHRANGQDCLWHGGHGCMDFIGNIEVAPGADGTDTLRPINGAEIAAAPAGDNNNVKGGQSARVPMGKKLFDVLGIARSKDGRNMTYNMIHAGNERVQVVGIPVGPDEGGGQTEKRVIREDGRVFVRDVVLQGAAIERFEKMTDAELLGPVPPQGVAGVVRPTK
jgi:hypothetical protein